MSKNKKKAGKKNDDWVEPATNEGKSEKKEAGDDFVSFTEEYNHEQEEDVSELLSQVMNASKKDSKNKKKQKKLQELEEIYSGTTEKQNENVDTSEVTTEENTNKGKKGKKGKRQKEDFYETYDANNPTSIESETPKNENENKVVVDNKADGEENEGAKNAKKKGKKNEPKKTEASSTTPATQSTTVTATPSVAAPNTANAKEDPKSKKKSPGAAIKAMLQKQREEEERIRKIQEEEERKYEEETARLKALEIEREEAKKRKKEKEKQRKEQLKKEGKLLSKTEKERQQKLEQARQLLMQQTGIKVGVTPTEGQETQEKKKKPIYGKKKPNQKNEQKVEEKDQKEKEENDGNQPLKLETLADNWEDIDLDDIAIPKIPEQTDALESEEEEEEIKPVQSKPQPQSSSKKTDTEKEKEKTEGDNDEDEDDEDDEDEDDDDDDDDDDDEEDEEDEQKSAAQKAADERKRIAKEKRMQRHQEAMAARSKDNLRSPICCILGHVDTGKTKILDKIRQTDVQGGEAGGITQQIGATYFPGDIINQKVAVLGLSDRLDVRVPGLLIIDTPGHESFTNLRNRGSSLCNIAILVIDIMHYLEPQTIESINLLKQRKTPFIVALNKVDRIYGWKENPDSGFQETLKKQSESSQREFENRVAQTKLALAEQGFNSELYYRNKDFKNYVSIVPTSAVTGEGIPDMIMLLVQLTQRHLTDQLMYLSELEATVLEVKVTEGQGTTIDVVLSNGYLREGDKICLCGLNGPIISHVRALLTPQPLRELRVKSQYVHHKEVKAAIGVKIAAPGLEKAIAGSRLMVIGPDDDEDDIKEEVMSDLAGLFKSIDKSGKGVTVQASTLGSLEALLEFLRVSKIPVFSINIGPVHKKDVIRSSIMLERHKEFAVMLCFDVKVEREAEEIANELGVKIFKAEIIYHLFDQFNAYMNGIQEQKKKDMAPSAVFPCVLRILPAFIFNTRNPILVGVNVVDGTLRLGTPICVPAKGKIFIGRVTGIENNHKTVESAKKSQDVAIKIELPNYETPKMLGRHFAVTDDLVSMISRESIDILKEAFRDEMTKEDWTLVIKLKKVLGIP